MNLLLATLPAGLVLVYATKLPLAIEMAKAPGGYNNHDPRTQQASLEGRGRRAAAAHANAFEAFPPFAAGVIVCHTTGAAPGIALAFSLVHLIARAIYPFLYIFDRASLRSTAWFIGFLATAGLLVLPLVCSQAI